MRLLLTLLLLLPVVNTQAEEIEDCVLDTIKGAPASQAIASIKYYCTQKYIRTVEKTAKSVPLDLIGESTLQWFPNIPAFPSPIHERVEVSLHNKSTYKIVKV